MKRMTLPQPLLRLSWMTLLSLVLVACSTATPPAPVLDDQAGVEILKPELDPRVYRYIELPNRMKVLLVSDPDTDKSAASLAVRAGSGNNPRTRQGLAHFLEHMLFLGTEKYPDPGGYLEFISAHGGSHNAYTSIDHTNYFFDISPDSLDEALDRFADFFVSPNMDPQYVDREMNAVDSEYNLGLKDDGRREFDVFSEVVNPQHPLSMLAVGNLETLSGGETDIREDLLKFYDSHYSANLMSLVVVGRDSLDRLESMVRSRFEAVEDRSLSEMTTAPSLFRDDQLPMAIHIEPVKDLREINLLFPVPSAKPHYGSKPMEYIGNLLGHEGKGSLFSVLKERGWAERLGAGSGLDFYGQDAFQISIELTPEGLLHRDEIVALAFAAIERVRDEGIEKWRFDEQGKLSELAFRFREKGSPTGTAIGAANALWEYSPEEVFYGAYAFNRFDADLVRGYLDLMRPENLLLTVKYKGVETDHVSRWFDVPYEVIELDADALATGAPQDMVAQLALPAANAFVPDTVAVKAFAEEGDAPALIVDEPTFRQWYMQDAAFPAPKAALYVRVSQHGIREQAADQALAELYTRLVNDALTDIAYPAALAGLGYDISPTGRGVQLRLSGYDERQPVLLDTVLKQMREQRFDPSRFENIRRELMREWGNTDRDRPYQQLMRLAGPALAARNWTPHELRDALESQTPDDLAAWVDAFYADTTIEVLVHGNQRRDEALALGGQVRKALAGGDSGAVAPIEVLDLAEGSALALELDVDHPDSGVVYYIQGNDASNRERALMQLSSQIIKAEFFNDLRTEQQLGYVVAARDYPIYRVPGIGFIVQSANSSAATVVTAIETFIDAQAQRAAAMNDEEFARHRKALIDALRESPKTQAEKTGQLWADLSLGVESFDDREQRAQILEQVSLTQWRDYFNATIAADQRASLVLFNRGTANPGDGDGLEGYQQERLDALRKLPARYVFND